jgi:hypothetical protein
MKKLYAIIAVAGMTAAVSGWAQITTNVSQGLDITISGTLIPSGDKLSSSSLSGNTNPISIVDLEIINVSTNVTTTNDERWIGQVIEGATNLFLKEIRRVKIYPSLEKEDFDLVYAGTGQVGTSSNALLLASGTDTTTKKISHGVTNKTETVTATLKGIWLDEPATNSDETGEAVLGGLLDSVKKK